MPLFGGPPNLEKLEAEGDVKGLVKVLGYEKDWHICKAAAEALGHLGAPAVESLIAALKDRSRAYLAVMALGKIGDPRAIEPLIAALDYEEHFHCRAVAEALDKLGWQPDKTRRAVVSWIARDRPEMCAQIGEPAVEPLIALLQDKDSSIYRPAVVALGKIGDPRAVEPLISLLIKYYDPRAAVALGEIGDPRAVEDLIAVLKDKLYPTCESVAMALGEIGDPRAAEPLIALLMELKKVFHLWNWVGPREIIPREEMYKTLNRALRKLGVPVGHEFNFVDGDVALVNQCINELRRGNDSMRMYAAQMLGEIGDRRAVEPLIAALKDEALFVRIDVTRALGKIGDTRAVDPLIAHHVHEHDCMRRFAAKALGNIGDTRAVEPLIATLGDRSSVVRSAAVKALRAITGENLGLDSSRWAEWLEHHSGQEETRIFPDGSKYVGQFKEGKPHGKGTLTVSHGSAQYIGEFRDGRFHGGGRATFRDGTVYLGQFKDFEFHGQGTCIFRDGSKYMGGFEDGKFHGQGTRIFSDGVKYIGGWKDGKVQGRGALMSRDGHRYVGKSKDYMFNGPDTLISRDIRVLIDELKKGKCFGS